MNKENQEMIKAIVKKNNWEQYHNYKDLLLSINIELAELQEIFQWKQDADITQQDIELAKLEIADMLIYIQHLANKLNIDLDQAVKEKMDINMKRTWKI